MGETLTADTSGIMDPDGLSNPDFTYQWLADGRAISGATRSTYMLTKAYQGKQISVRVSFTDDGGDSETFTSTVDGTVPFPRDINVEAAMPLLVQEGGSVAYTVALNTEPTASVTVTVSSSDTDVTVSPSSLTFTTGTWSTARTVTVSAEQDTDAAAESVTLTHAASGADYGSVAVEIALAVFDDEAKPGQPTGLSASADGAYEIDLAWTAPEEVAFVPVTGYLIEVSEDAGVNWTVAKADTGSTGTTYAHTGLTAETTYRYRVSAISARAGGKGVASAEASATTTEDLACGRSREVRNAIVRKAGVDACGKVTAAHLANVQTLAFPASRAVPLKAGDFAGMSGLTGLDLAYQRFTTLPAGIFQDLPSLATLDLSHNLLTTLPAGIFQDLPSLTTLDLGQNRLSTLGDNKPSSLPDGLFLGLTNLTRLSLGSQGLFSDRDMWVPIRLEKVGEDRFKAVAPAGAPFSIKVPIFGALMEGGGTSITIPAGSRESAAVRVWSLTGATAGVAVGSPLPALPQFHTGYDLRGSGDAVEVSAAGQWSVAISPTAIAETDTGVATVTVDAGEHLSSQSHTFVLEIKGTAEAGVDYTVTDSGGNVLSSPYTMTLPGGTRSVTTTVTAVDDTIDDAGETIDVALVWRGNSVARKLITITDDDAEGPSQVTIAAPDVTLTEGAEAVFTLARSGSAAAALTVSVDVEEGTDFAPAGDLGARTVTFGAGSATATLTVATLDDSRAEHDGTITATVGSGDGYAAHATRGSADVRVVDNDWRFMVTVPSAEPSLEVSATEPPPGDSDEVRQIARQIAFYQYTVHVRTRPGEDPVTLNEYDVNWYTRPDTATRGADYSSAADFTGFGDISITWDGYEHALGFEKQPDGSYLSNDSQFFAEAKHDNLVEGDETFIIHIEVKPNVKVFLPQAEDGRHLRIRATIRDDDVATWSLSIDPDGDNGGQGGDGGGDGFGEQKCTRGLRRWRWN